VDVYRTSLMGLVLPPQPAHSRVVLLDFSILPNCFREFSSQLVFRGAVDRATNHVARYTATTLTPELHISNGALREHVILRKVTVRKVTAAGRLIDHDGWRYFSGTRRGMLH